MEVTAPGGIGLPEDQGVDASLELIAAELSSPLDVIKLSAEELVQQLRETHGDPGDISAAEKVLFSAEKMSRIVQALLKAGRAGLP